MIVHMIGRSFQKCPSISLVQDSSNSFHQAAATIQLRRMTMSRRSVHSIVSIPVGLNRASIITRDVTTDLLGEGLDPFLVASLFDMRGPTFPPHPHAGFAVATYILPESESAFINQDSTGFSNRIAQGGLHATIAGRGVLHEETNETEGVPALGFQIWINLRAADKLVKPRPVTLEAADVPVVAQNGAVLRVLAGASNGAISPFSLPTPIRLVDVDLAPGARFEQALTATEQAFLWVVKGSAYVIGEDGRQKATGLEAVRLNFDGEKLVVEAGEDGARFMLFAGEPIREPVVLGGPFVGSTRDQIDQFWADFRAGRMGQLTPFGQKKAA
jgi:redox-sensitive bicupin YhaK (pirin superfamily)